MMEFLVVVLVLGWCAFVVYMLIHHPETMFRIQKNVMEEQQRLEKKAGAVVKKAAEFAIKRWFR